MQQELIEMLEEIIPYVEVWHKEDQDVLDKAEALVEKAKNNAPAVPQGETVAWKYELAVRIDADGRGSGWCWHLTDYKPSVPDGMIRNLRPLTYDDAAPAVPQGWRFKRNTDGSVGIFAPSPKPGESQRTSHAVYQNQSGDLYELLGKLADHQATTPAPAPAQEVEPIWPLRAKVWKRESTQEWVLDIDGTLGSVNMTCRHTQPLSVAYEDVPGLPALYQAEPQEVGLTDEEIEAIAKKHMSTVGDHWCNEEAIREIHAEDFARDIIAALRAKGNKL